MYELIVFLLSPIIAFLGVNYNLDTKTFELKKVKDSLGEGVVIFIATNVTVFAVITLLKGKVDIVSSMKGSTKFALIYFIISFLSGVTVAILYRIYKYKKVTIEYKYSSIAFLKIILSRIIKLIPYIVAIVDIVILIMLCINNDFWGDEAFTINAINSKNSFQDICMMDISNPPLYFLILKLFIMLLGAKPFVYHFASAFPTILLIIFVLHFVKKDFGEISTTIFLTLLIMTSMGRTYSLEVRMYAWAAFFFVICFYCTYWLVLNNGKNLSRWVMACAFGIAAAYVHYFTLAAVMLLFLFAFIRLICNDRRNLWKCILATVVCIGAYFPWISIFLYMVKALSGGFWTTEILSIKNGFIGIFGDEKLLIIYLILLCFAIIISLEIVKFERRSKKWNVKFLFLNTEKETIDKMWVVLTPPLIALGILVFENIWGKVMAPVFWLRYLYPVIVTTWLSMGIAVNSLKNKKYNNLLGCIIIISIILVLGPTFKPWMDQYKSSNGNTRETTEQINMNVKDKDNVVMLSDNTHFVWCVLQYYFPYAQIDAYSEENIKKYGKLNEKEVILILNSKIDELENNYNFELITAGYIAEGGDCFIYKVNPYK